MILIILWQVVAIRKIVHFFCTFQFYGIQVLFISITLFTNKDLGIRRWDENLLALRDCGTINWCFLFTGVSERACFGSTKPKKTATFQVPPNYFLCMSPPSLLCQFRLFFKRGRGAEETAWTVQGLHLCLFITSHLVSLLPHKVTKGQGCGVAGEMAQWLSVRCSFRRPEFNFSSHRSGSQLPETPAPEDLILSSGLPGHVHSHVHTRT